MEGSRETLADKTGYQPRRWRMAYGALGNHRLLLAGSTLLAAAQRVGLVPKRVNLPRLPLRRRRLEATGTDVWLFTGCVMDAWQRPVHQAVVDVLRHAGVGVAFPERGGDCCGALHVHAGLVDGARMLARRVMESMPGDTPVLVDSAGCGAALKDYGHLLGTAKAEAFSARVFDVHEWMAAHMERLPPVKRRLSYRVAVQDPCHLRHVQRAHQHVRTVLAPYADLVELDDEGLCCGAGGAYSQLEPVLAADIRARKLASIDRAKPDVVVSANPGCAMHLAAGHVRTAHPMELVWQALSRAREVRQA
jgi:glycolate oxidase iron-sulfur subunit